jgi:hypothetical protein
MGVNGRRPFTEIIEVAQTELVREAASNQEDKYKGFVNQVYLNELPSLLPEEYIRKEAFITLLAQHTTGTVTVGTGTAGVQGASTSWTSALTNYNMKINGYDRIWRMTFSADTLMTFQNSLSWVFSSGSGLSYQLFQDRYQLPSDFAYMVEDDPEDPNVVSRYVSASQLFLDPLNNDDFERQFNGIIGDLWAYTVKWISETPYLLVLSAPSVADILRFHYIPQLTTLAEYTTGTVTFTTGTAVIAAGGALWSANVNTANNIYFIRNDADGSGSSSKWARILTVVNDTALTLSAAWGNTSGTGQTYTISEISKWPARFDDAILYKTALIADPDNVQVQKWTGLYQEALNLDKSVESMRKKIRPFKEFFGKRAK